MRKLVTLSLALFSTAAAAQTVPIDVEAGFRILRLSGSSDMYRTQINERSGLLIRSLTLAAVETSFADYFRVDATDLGVGPAGALRIDVGRSSLYRFTLTYRQTNAFSALPAFANGQHTYDRRRRMVDADLELRKWSAITPFFGFSVNRYSGPGTTTVHIGQDEFALLSRLDNREQEIRGGFGFSYKMISGQVTQGWRSFRDHETLTLAPGASAGNNSDPILGRQISAGSITRDDRASGHTPFTSIFATGQFTSRLRVLGNYVRFAARSDGNETESATGAFTSFAISRFFNGFTDDIDGRAKNTTWRGGARAEVTVTDKIDFFGGFEREHRELQGSALINQLFLQTVNFGGVDPRDVRVIIDAHDSLVQDEDLLSAAVSARALGPFSLRAGVSTSKQDVTISPDLAEIVVPGPSQGGTRQRRVNTWDLSGAYGRGGFTAGAAWRHDSANDPIMRTDFLERDRFRLRAGWISPHDFIRAAIIAEESHPKNDRPEFAYDAKIRQYTAEGEIAATQSIRLRASAARLRANSTMLYRRPENFTTDTSRHVENGSAREAGGTFTFPRVSVDASLAHFENTGTTPFDLDRFRTRVMIPLVAKTGLTVEWDRDRYREPEFSFGNFRADRYGLYLRWTQ